MKFLLYTIHNQANTNYSNRYIFCSKRCATCCCWFWQMFRMIASRNTSQFFVIFSIFASRGVLPNHTNYLWITLVVRDIYGKMLLILHIITYFTLVSNFNLDRRVQIPSCDINIDTSIITYNIGWTYELKMYAKLIWVLLSMVVVDAQREKFQRHLFPYSNLP